MNKAQAVRTRHPKAVTRATILAKAYEMYLDRRLVHGDERLSSVLDELGYTTGAGYQIWANQAEFRADLQVYVAENIEYASPSIVADDILALRAQDPTVEQLTLGIADLYLERMVGSEAFLLTLRFFGMSADRPPEITEALSDSYERSGWQIRERLENALAMSGRRVKGHFQIDDLVMAITALLEGYALRSSVQRDRVMQMVEFADGKHYGFSVAFLGVIQQFTESIPED